MIGSLMQCNSVTNVRSISESSVLFHKFIWLYISFFPVLPGVLGASLAQQLMHATFLPVLIVCFIIKGRLNSVRTVVIGTIVVCGFVTYYSVTTIIMTKEITIRDITDILRPAIYFMYVLIPLCIPLSSSELKVLLDFLKKIIFIQICFSLLVYIQPMWPIVDLYKGRPSSDMALHFYRWSGTYGYPSDFSFLLSFLVFYYLGMIVIKEKISRFGLILLMFSILAIYFTYSRGGILSTAGILIFAIFKTKIIKRPEVLISVFIAATLLLVFVTKTNNEDASLHNSYLISMFEEDTDSSTEHRLRELNIAAEYATRNPPFGAGPSRIELSSRISVIESFYGHHLIKWGFLGLVAILAVKLLIVERAIYLFKVNRNHSKEIAAFAFSVALLTLSEVVFFGFSSAITDRFKNLPTYYLWVGYLFMMTSYNRSYTHQTP